HTISSICSQIPADFLSRPIAAPDYFGPERTPMTTASTNGQLPAINALWIGQLSPVERLCLGSFAAQGHPVHLYAYDPIDNLPAGVTIQDATQILPREMIFKNQLGKGKGSLAAFSDLFRFKLMLDRGGWWVDADIFCLKPFDFTSPYVFGFEGTGVASGAIKMPRGCKLAQRCFDLASRVDPSTILWIQLLNIPNPPTLPPAPPPC